MPALLTLSISLTFACGCVTRGQRVLSKGSDAEIYAEGLRAASADIAAGKLRVCYAGTRAVYPIGVPDEYLDLMRGLPRFPLPNGCTNPLAMPAARFAEAYNTTIVIYLTINKKERDDDQLPPSEKSSGPLRP